MDNMQYGPTGPYITNQSTPPNKKAKVAIVTLIVVLVIALIALTIFIFNKNSQQPSASDEELSPSETVQIYAALSDEIPIQDIEKVVRGVNSNATVTFEDEYGTIVMPGNENEFISFYYDDENNEVNEAAEEPEDDFDDPWASIYEKHSPNTAYDFIYVYNYPNGDFNVYINRIYDGVSIKYQFYDGSDAYEYNTKQEAIDDYLTSSI